MDLKAFIETEIKQAKDEVSKIDALIQEKAAALIAKKAPFEKKINDLEKLLKDYDKVNKPK